MLMLDEVRPFAEYPGAHSFAVNDEAFGFLSNCFKEMADAFDSKYFHAGLDVRWVNEWNNLDGTIERGYGGRSIFWDNLQAREDLTRVGEYGRLLASLGINACSINNVNANPRVLAADFIPQIVRIAEAFRPWGVRVALAVDFGSPKTIGGLDTFDPARCPRWPRGGRPASTRSTPPSPISPASC